MTERIVIREGDLPADEFEEKWRRAVEKARLQEKALIAERAVARQRDLQAFYYRRRMEKGGDSAGKRSYQARKEYHARYKREHAEEIKRKAHERYLRKKAMLQTA